MKSVICMLSVVLLSGCSSMKQKGFNRGELSKQLGVVNHEVTDQEIKEALSRKPNLPKPFKVAVFFKTPNNTSSNYYQKKSEWRWTPEDRELFVEVEERLKKENLISEMIPLIDSVVQTQDLKSLRLVAAKHGADALLIISGVGDIDQYINNWGYSYFLLLPGLFVKGTEVDTLFISSASLWDVRNEYLYLTAEAESLVNKTVIPAFSPSRKDLFSEAKKDSLNKLKSQVSKMIDGIK